MSVETTDFAANLTINWLLTNGAATRPTAWYIAIGTGSNATGLTGEKSGNGYARQAVTFGAAASRGTSNTGTITFGPNTTADWGTCSHFGIYDASTNGNCLFAGSLATSKTITVGDSLEIATGQATVATNAYAD